MTTIHTMTQDEARIMLEDILNKDIPYSQSVQVKITGPTGETLTPDFATRNKISLIKLVRSIAEDVLNGRVDIRKGSDANQPTVIGLAESKQWVERYFNLV